YASSTATPYRKNVLITVNQKKGYQNVALVDVASKKLTWVTDTKWEASSADFSRDGKSFTYTLNEDGRIDSYLVDRPSMRAEKIELPPGLNSFVSTPTAFSPDGNRLLMSHESSVNPADIWVYDIAKRSA